MNAPGQIGSRWRCAARMVAGHFEFMRTISRHSKQTRHDPENLRDLTDSCSDFRCQYCARKFALPLEAHCLTPHVARHGVARTHQSLSSSARKSRAHHKPWHEAT